MRFIYRTLIISVILLLVARFIPGFIVKDELDLILFCLIIGAINGVIRPILVFLTLPITVLSLGLFLIFINAFTFYLAAKISYGIQIHSFWGAVIGGVIVWCAGLISNRFIEDI